MDSSVSSQQFRVFAHISDISRRPHKAMIPEWLETLGGIYSAMSKTPSSALETIIELAKDHLLGDIKASDGNVHKEWMRGTYVDEGVLIRHGS